MPDKWEPMQKRKHSEWWSAYDKDGDLLAETSDRAELLEVTGREGDSPATYLRTDVFLVSEATVMSRKEVEQFDPKKEGNK